MIWEPPFCGSPSVRLNQCSKVSAPIPVIRLEVAKQWPECPPGPIVVHSVATCGQLEPPFITSSDQICELQTAGDHNCRARPATLWDANVHHCRSYWSRLLIASADAIRASCCESGIHRLQERRFRRGPPSLDTNGPPTVAAEAIALT